MYQENFVVPFPAGIHYGTLSAFFAHFRPGTITINGLDPTDQNQADGLVRIGQGDEVQIAANSGNPQYDRDAVHIAEGIIQQGRDPWQKPGQKMELPDERYNQAANFVRQNWLGLPPEEGGQVTASAAPEPPNFREATKTDECCKLCKMMDKGKCWGYGNKAVGDDDVCDSFYPESKVSKWAALEVPEHFEGAPAKVNEIYDELKGEYDNATTDLGEDDKADLANAAAQTYKKHEGAAVSSDMSVISKWKVVALGELQQPSGVGATQDYNPVVDGPNPDALETDNAANSPEQEVAMQTWVNVAVDLLNRGEPQEAIVAKLAHDGCPNPQEILQRAQQQPMEEHPVSDSIGQDPFQAPPAADSTGQMESVSQQPSVLASNANEIGGPIGEPADSASIDTPEDLFDVDGTKKTEGDLFVDAPAETDNHVAPIEFKDETPVQETKDVHSKRVRVAGTTMVGTELDRWESMWGEGTVKIALDEGGTIQVSPDAVETLDENSPEHPVSEIQQFIDSMPEVEPSRPHIEARLANLELVRRAVRANISKVGFSDQVKLQAMDTAAEEETALLREALGNLHEEYEVDYFKGQRRYEVNAFAIAEGEVKEWEGRPREAGAIWAAENFTGPTTEENLVEAAAHHASALGLTGSQFEQFLAGAFEDGLKDLPEVTSEENPNAENVVIDHEGPADALFV